MKSVIILLVRCYQVLVSPFLPPACRFFPSCSHYGIQALDRHGAIRGTALTAWRILRCQPLCRGGFDPVP